MNIQEIRREFDRAFAEALHVKLSRSTNEHGARVRDSQRRLRQLMGLRNMSAPPALEAAVFDALRWSEDLGEHISLDQRIEELSQQLRDEVTLWAQEIVGAMDTLNNIRDCLSGVQNLTVGSVLRRSVVTDADLESLVEHLANGVAGPGLPKCPSAWDICCQSATKSAEQI
jgi:hypothetical protein